LLSPLKKFAAGLTFAIGAIALAGTAQADNLKEIKLDHAYNSPENRSLSWHDAFAGEQTK